MATQQASNSCSFPSLRERDREWEFDVFINFRGPETRYGFTGYLHKAFCEKGIRTFMDAENLISGNKILETFDRAIESSRIGIIVFSAHYADTDFLLRELVKLLECSRRKGQFILPIFYYMDPGDVRHQRGSYEKAMAVHEERFKDEVPIWRAALRDAANLCGLHFKGDEFEYEFIERTSKQVLAILKEDTLPVVADYPVRAESQVKSFSNPRQYQHHVFLNFRGCDTRYRFTGSLYKALQDKKIHTFMDDVGLHRGNDISRTLIQAIKGSRIAIIVFSENYADSSYCLDELVKILECHESDGQFVLPVFYDIYHDHVRYHTGSYGKAMAKHEEKFKDDLSKVEKWKQALFQAANFTGFVFEGKQYEHEFIGKIVEVVSREIKRVALPVADYLTGLESQVSVVKSLLFSDGYDGVQVVGIHGNAGSGKTKVAHAIYHLISNGFESICFLENVRENSYNHGLVYLQNMLLSNVFERKNLKATSFEQGISTIKHWLQQKKILLILDDVDKPEQLQALAGKPDWFGLGTRVIVTTRDKCLLESHWIKRIYEMENSNSESNINASPGKDNREQLGEKSTSGDQVNGSLEPLVSEDISLERSKQASLIQAESNTEVIGCNENQADICHTHFPERIDNGKKEVPTGNREVDMAEKCFSAQLESLEEKKRELEEQIRAIKAEIAGFHSRDTVAKEKKRSV
ncbi:disease resistance protein RPV1-like isoform X2 [Arachis stenosperma]|uniref:disease resistance protein RPV1-like isoform X2 n=1 Tax=Arachis stenosperma TaxID=217475 RepID=UPI0025AD2842|nr:disease resistance protein RPV1-like isoform X2 [Arachis stenosperma]